MSLCNNGPADVIVLFLDYIVNKRLMLTRIMTGNQSYQSLHCLHMQKTMTVLCIHIFVFKSFYL